MDKKRLILLIILLLAIVLIVLGVKGNVLRRIVKIWSCVLVEMIILIGFI